MPIASNPRIPFQMSSERAKLSPPQGKPFIVHLVVNVEYWPFDQPTPRTIVVPPHGRSHVPDLPNFAWSEYGNRCGMPRLIKALTERRLPVSAPINATVLDVYESLAAAMREHGWEFFGHGLRQQSQGTEMKEADTIKEAIRRLTAFTGKPTRGWMSPGWSETFDTPDLLKEAGIEYVTQWVVDDLPTWINTKHGKLIALPYGLDLNDSVIYAIEKSSTTEMKLRLTEAIRTFEREIHEEQQPRVLTIPLHPHLSGVPHRINFLMEVLDTLMARKDTIFMNGGQLAAWFSSVAKPS